MRGGGGKGLLVKDIPKFLHIYKSSFMKTASNQLMELVDIFSSTNKTHSQLLQLLSINIRLIHNQLTKAFKILSKIHQIFAGNQNHPTGILTRMIPITDQFEFSR